MTFGVGRRPERTAIDRHKSIVPRRRNRVVALCVAICACSSPESTLVPTEPVSSVDSDRNILLIIADDLGKDAMPGFAEGAVKPATPTLNSLATQGLTFTNLWVTPTCAPTRASIITGRHGFRTGVTRSGAALSPAETTLQAYIASASDRPYATAVVGKWHLARSASFNPESMGIDYYAGILSADIEDYYAWPLTADGVTTNETGYSTEVLTDLAIDWVQAQDDSWFLWLAYNAPHTPFHVPPAETHAQGTLPPYQQGVNGMPYYMAAIESMDFHIGRLLDSLSPAERAETTVIFIGDNGSPRQAVQAPYTANTAKGSVYQGGINTPMLVSGGQLRRQGTDESVISSTDLFATIAELAGVPVTQIHDSRSFSPLLSAPAPHRDYAFSGIEEAGAGTWTTARGDRFKLIVRPNGDEEMFDLLADPYERTDLIQLGLNPTQATARADLVAWLNGLGTS